MAHIKPFQALIYNRSIIPGMHSVISPPYDVITEDDRTDLQSKSPYNAVGLDLTNPSLLPPNSNDNRHEASKKTMHDWMARRVLIQEQEPCLYLVKDTFEWSGRKHERLGLLCTVEMEKPGDTILPHEKVLSTPIEDRMKLLKTVQAHLSPVFFICHDPKEEISEFIDNLVAEEKSESFLGTHEGLSHQIWKIQDSKEIEHLQKLFEHKKLLIADGHHRYQTAYLYSLADETQEMQEAKRMLSYISLFPSEGLLVSAFHRFISTDVSHVNFLEMIHVLFEIEKKPLSWESFNQSDASLALVNSKDACMHLLRPKSPFPLLVDELVKIPSSLLNVLLLQFLRIDIADKEHQKRVAYFSNEEKLLQTRHQGLGFWLKPVFIPDIFEATQLGHVLPPKSTYFFPKVPTGLAFHLIKS